MFSHNLIKTVPSMKMKNKGCQRKSQVFAACKIYMYVALKRILIFTSTILGFYKYLDNLKNSCLLFAN